MGWFDDLFSSETESTSEQQSSSQLNPWENDGGALQRSTDWTNRALNQNPWTTYGGPQVAGFSPMQQQAFGAMGNWFGNQGMGGANALNQYGMQGLNAGQGAQNYYQGLLGQDPAARAAQFANSPYMNAQVDAASRDITRNLGENILPGIAGSSLSSGNLGSSRRGAAEAIAARGAADRIGDISASMRGDAYQNMLNQTLGQQNMAAAGLQGMAGQAMNALMGGQNLFGQNYAGLLGAGNQQQALQQQMNDAAMRNFYMQQQMPYQQAQAGQGLALTPAQMFGRQTGQSSGTQTQIQRQNPYGAMINIGAQLAGGALGMMNPMA